MLSTMLTKRSGSVHRHTNREDTLRFLEDLLCVSSGKSS